MAQKKRPQKNKHTNTLRIIGGEWRSRKLQIIDAPGMR
ncbi:MAG TPA: 16S rRNA (guanine(966)-N(2))-methyltransferase RsmD, partial [Leucothrix sp.]|nr:16S rRNA (guanine(966)-N(2))-methyltransferase RsmD [Leucothrix sp.]